jgi:predicted  nucleic acid-binding Zn-ribbon protein
MTETLLRLLALQACDQRIQQATRTLDALQQSLAAVKEEEQVRVQEVQTWQDKIRASAAVEKELRAAREKRRALTSGINTFLLQEYERIFSRRGRVAVVALVNEACQGCHMHLPPQMCLELQRHPKLTFCPHCHRILFVPVETNPHVMEPHSVTKGANGHPPRQPRQHAKSKARTAKEPDGAILLPASPAQV